MNTLLLVRQDLPVGEANRDSAADLGGFRSGREHLALIDITHQRSFITGRNLVFSRATVRFSATSDSPP